MSYLIGIKPSGIKGRITRRNYKKCNRHRHTELMKPRDKIRDFMTKRPTEED
jgi:hypothetical protein